MSRIDHVHMSLHVLPVGSTEATLWPSLIPLLSSLYWHKRRRVIIILPFFTWKHNLVFSCSLSLITFFFFSNFFSHSIALYVLLTLSPFLVVISFLNYILHCISAQFSLFLLNLIILCLVWKAWVNCLLFTAIQIIYYTGYPRINYLLQWHRVIF